MTARLITLDVASGARQAVPAVMDVIREVGRHPSPVHDRERAALAELLQAAAWILFDAEEHETSHRLHLRALAMARDGKDGPAPIEPLILAVLSMQEAHLGRPGRSLRIASSVLARKDIPDRVAAIFHVRASRALAGLQRRTEALSSLRTAQNLFMRDRSDHDPAWCWWFDQTELDGHHGLVLAELGDLEDSATLLHRASHPDEGPAYRALFAGELARVLALGSAWREADRALSSLMGTVPTIGSVRALRSLGRTTRIIEQGRGVPRGARDTARHLAFLLREMA
ncbi:hypothetical protein [Streptomyces sp. 8N706]|uniref:hypothetical protein n=1 Tax=Streptomyces sp. 8N706 TaxID=3457416 RepID=UPI003FD04A04